jgi:hypothetical protein
MSTKKMNLPTWAANADRLHVFHAADGYTWVALVSAVAFGVARLSEPRDELVFEHLDYAEYGFRWAELEKRTKFESDVGLWLRSLTTQGELLQRAEETKSGRPSRAPSLWTFANHVKLVEWATKVKERATALENDPDVQSYTENPSTKIEDAFLDLVAVIKETP